MVIVGAPKTFKYDWQLELPHLLVATILYEPTSEAVSFLNKMLYLFWESDLTKEIVSLNLISLLSLKNLKSASGRDLTSNSQLNWSFKEVIGDSNGLIKIGGSLKNKSILQKIS